MAPQEKFTNWAIGLSIFAGTTCLGMFFMLSVLSLFGTGHYAGYIARFLILGGAYLTAGVGLLKKKSWAAWLGIGTASFSCVIFIAHYTFVTANAVNGGVIISRILWHAPLLAAYFMSLKESNRSQKET